MIASGIHENNDRVRGVGHVLFKDFRVLGLVGFKRPFGRRQCSPHFEDPYRPADYVLHNLIGRDLRLNRRLNMTQSARRWGRARSARASGRCRVMRRTARCQCYEHRDGARNGSNHGKNGKGELVRKLPPTSCRRQKGNDYTLLAVAVDVKQNPYANRHVSVKFRVSKINVARDCRRFDI